MMEATAEYPRAYDGYLLLERIGAGGMSEVDLACRAVEDASYIRFMVIKRMIGDHVQDESFVRMFTDEARITAELHHENIAQVYDFGKVTNPRTGSAEYFLAMEYVAGPDLRVIQRRCLAKGEHIPVRFSLAVVHDVLAALEYAHTRRDTLGHPMQIVHRDVNPRNVMISVGGEVKLIDFGVAFAGDLFRSERTTGRGLKGKWAYMSPEQIEHTDSLDGRSDLFAVGLMLHELIELRSPFAGLNEVQIMHRVLNSDVEALTALGTCAAQAEIMAIHRKALQRQRDDRYPTAKAMREDILAASELLGGLMTREERGAYLKRIAPEVVDEVSERMRLYRAGIPQSGELARLRSSRAARTAEEGTVAGADSIVTQGGLSVAEPTRRGHARSVFAVVLSVVLVSLAMWVFPEDTEQPVAPAQDGPSVSELLAPPPPVVEEVPTAAPEPVEDFSARESAPVTVAPVAAPRRAEPTKAVSLPEPTPDQDVEEVVETSPEPAQEVLSEVKEQPVETGLLLVVSKPSAQVFLDGDLIGSTPIQNYALSVGTHQVRLVDTAGRAFEQTVSITARQVSAVRHSFDTSSNSSGRQR